MNITIDTITEITVNNSLPLLPHSHSPSPPHAISVTHLLVILNYLEVSSQARKTSIEPIKSHEAPSPRQQPFSHFQIIKIKSPKKSQNNPPCIIIPQYKQTPPEILGTPRHASPKHPKTHITPVRARAACLRKKQRPRETQRL